MTTVKETTEEVDARIEERRRQILDAAAAVFARRGYHQARTREIAREAGIAEGTIYNYFPGKRDLLLGLLDRVVTESIPQMYQEPESDDLAALARAFLRDRLEMLERNQQLFKVVVPEMINDEELRWGYLRQVIVHLVNALAPLQQRALATGELRTFNPRVVLPAIAGATITAFVFNEMVAFPMGETASREELTDELLDLFLEGLHRHVGPQVHMPGSSASTSTQSPRWPALPAEGPGAATHDTVPGMDGEQ